MSSPQISFCLNHTFWTIFYLVTTNTSGVFLLAGLSRGSGTHGAGPRHQRVPIRLGGLPPSAGAGTEEEGDGLVQGDAGFADDQARRGAAASESIRPHRWARAGGRRRLRVM